jgi:hypothetical protein
MRRQRTLQGKGGIDRAHREDRPARAAWAAGINWPGRLCRARPMMTLSVNAIEMQSGSAEATSAPRQATTSDAATAPAATAAPACSAASATPASAAAAASAPGDLHAVLGGCGVLLVENIERRQADVGDFFFTESDGVTRSKVRRQRLILRRRDRSGRTARQRESQSRGSQHRYSFCYTFALRSLLYPCHNVASSIPCRCSESRAKIVPLGNVPCKAGCAR